jgi:hypothetical protein
MKTLALVLAMIFAAGMSWADDGDAPLKPPPFRPWQEVWQCNDVRVTITSRSPEEIEYDLGGMIWGGSRITVVRGNFYNRWPPQSGDLLPPSPPAEKATARQDQARQSSTDDGAGDFVEVGYQTNSVRESVEEHALATWKRHGGP